MTSEAKIPVALRVVRPYETPEDFLAVEAGTVAKTGVLLLGANARPQGIILRFELALTSGEPLVRGEGRVVGYRENVMLGLPGLILKFTRLDAASKDFVDRATHEGPPPSVLPPAPGDIDPYALPSLPPQAELETIEGPSLEEATSVSMAILPLHAKATSDDANRDALLERLRERQKSLTPDQIAAILGHKR